MSSTRPLSLQEASCPICLGVFILPVTMPCSHTLCATCLRASLKHCSLNCPLCRRRLSVWLRRSTRRSSLSPARAADARLEGSLVNSVLWRRVQEQFPELVERRLAGVDDDVFTPESHDAPLDGVLSSPGDVGAEFAVSIQADISRREQLRHSEWAASRQLILKLLQDPSPAPSPYTSSPLGTDQSCIEPSAVKRLRSDTSSPPLRKKLKSEVSADTVTCSGDGTLEESFDKHLLEQQRQIERQLQQEREDRKMAEQIQQHFNQLQSPLSPTGNSYSLRSSRRPRC